MATQRSIERAAQAWCDPKTVHLVMEPDLAYVFAEMLDEKDAAIEELRVQLADNPPEEDEDIGCGAAYTGMKTDICAEENWPDHLMWHI